MNNEEFQEVTDRSWIFPLACLCLLVGLALLPLGRSSPEKKVIQARAKAEVLAYQVAQLYKESLESQGSSEEFVTSGRGPASVRMPSSETPVNAPAEGLMGQDPWGRPYRYKISTEPDGRLLVEMRSWGSEGPSGQSNEIVLNLSF